MAHIYIKANNTSTNCYFYPYVNSSTQEKVNLLHCSCYQTTRKELFNMARENKFLKSPAENLSYMQQVGSSKSQEEIPREAKGSQTQSFPTAWALKTQAEVYGFSRVH